MSNDAATNRWRYFGLALLLFVFSGAAVFFGFQIGYDRGYSSGRRWSTEKLQSINYEVGDLVELDQNGKPELDSLKDALTTTIEPESWSDEGGPGDVITMRPDKLIVTQAPYVHEQIRKVLERIREGKRNKIAKSNGVRPQND